MVLRHALEAPPAGEQTEFRPVPRRMEWAAMVLAIGAVVLGIRAVEMLEMLERGGVRPWG
jgi:hypothetical protein